MEKEAINKAIAEAVGRKYHRPSAEEIKSGSYYQYEPDYAGDLNACHEMEKRLTGEQWGNYKAHLIDLVFSNPPTNRGIIHATAAQRAEAFLKTIKKWVTP